MRTIISRATAPAADNFHHRVFTVPPETGSKAVGSRVHPQVIVKVLFKSTVYKKHVLLPVDRYNLPARLRDGETLVGRSLLQADEDALDTVQGPLCHDSLQVYV
ncbi:hypothetical protein OA88_22785 [Flavobacterium sp. JRM]|nr:hypothetical protein OA88_22785 [Flavobacterium sp. JRM]